MTISKKDGIVITLSGTNIGKAINVSKANIRNIEPETNKESEEVVNTGHLDILQYIPNEVVSEMDESTLEILRHPSRRLQDNSNDNDVQYPKELDVEMNKT